MLREHQTAIPEQAPVTSPWLVLLHAHDWIWREPYPDPAGRIDGSDLLRKHMAWVLWPQLYREKGK